MFKNRFILVLGVISLLSVTMAVSYPRSNASSAAEQVNRGSFLQHPEWRWRTTNQNVVIPLTGNNDAAFPDYHQRHPELSVRVEASVDTTDYYFRHPELSAAGVSTPLAASPETPGLACESPVDCR